MGKTHIFLYRILGLS